jgi:hypothetical protein
MILWRKPHRRNPGPNLPKKPPGPSLFWTSFGSVSLAWYAIKCFRSLSNLRKTHHKILSHKFRRPGVRNGSRSRKDERDTSVSIAGDRGYLAGLAGAAAEGFEANAHLCHGREGGRETDSSLATAFHPNFRAPGEEVVTLIFVQLCSACIYLAVCLRRSCQVSWNPISAPHQGVCPPLLAAFNVHMHASGLPGLISYTECS